MRGLVEVSVEVLRGKDTFLLRVGVGGLLPIVDRLWPKVLAEILESCVFYFYLHIESNSIA